MAEGEELCAHCGAPRVTGYAACKFCKTPFASVKNTQTNAIPCPQCQTLNELGGQRCVQCQTWLVVQCVFCHALSPHNVPACQKCGEAFAGAPQRFAERQSQQRLQSGLQIAGQVGNVAATVLGAAAVAGVFSAHEHHHHGHHHYEGGYPPNYEGGYPPNYVDNGANIQQVSGSSEGGFFSSLFGSSDSSSSSSDGNLAVESGSSDGGGILGSLFGSSDSSSSSDSSDSGGSFWDSDDS